MGPLEQEEDSNSEAETVDAEETKKSDEDELSRAQFINSLKKWKAQQKTISDAEESDAEMQKEFDDNRPGKYDNSLSEFDSTEYDEEEDHVEDIDDDVEITKDNIDLNDYDVSQLFSQKFYFE